MYRKFRHLDKDQNGVISMDEFKMIPALSVNPLLERMVTIFDSNHGIVLIVGITFFFRSKY
jgi:Ca2+-binding EF-hand superfamily protein